MIWTGPWRTPSRLVIELLVALQAISQAVEEETDDDDYDSGGSAGIALTPPDSPGCMRQVAGGGTGYFLIVVLAIAAVEINPYPGRN